MQRIEELSHHCSRLEKGLAAAQQKAQQAEARSADLDSQLSSTEDALKVWLFYIYIIILDSQLSSAEDALKVWLFYIYIIILDSQLSSAEDALKVWFF